MNKKLRKASLFIVSALLLTSCDTESIGDKIANAIPNLWLTLAQFAAFLVTVFVFFIFAYKPIKRKLKDRQDYIESNIQESEQAKTEALKSQETADQNIKESRIQANQIIEEARKAGETEKQQIIDNANAQADQIRKQGDIDAAEKQKAVDRKAHNEIVVTAIEASKEILGRELTKEDNEKVIDDFIEKMKTEADK